jgi:hypothetical protein
MKVPHWQDFQARYTTKSFEYFLREEAEARQTSPMIFNYDCDQMGSVPFELEYVSKRNS